MKLPQTPPALDSIIQGMGNPRFLTLVGQMDSLSRGDRYLHWDELRRRAAPEGFTVDEWWLGLKLARQSAARLLPLPDAKGASFRFGQPDVLSKLLHEIDRGLGFAFDVPDAAVSAGERDTYIVRSLVEESITSSQLEGASTTREIAKDMLRTGRPPRDTSERMILNNYLTMQRIRDLRERELTTDLVFELQSRIAEGTLEKPDALGRFRRADEDIRVVDGRDDTELHTPPPAEQLPERMSAMCDFANGRTPDYFVHPVIRAIILHFWLAYDHPFVDGNGRTARALFYWAMLRQNYTLFEFISISQILRRAPIQYSVRSCTRKPTERCHHFILHQAGVIRDAVEALHDYVRRRKTELRNVEQTLRAVEVLNHRQQALMTHALRSKHTRYLIAGHQRSHQVTHQTARDDLFDLVGRGLLNVEKSGRRYVFTAVPALEDKLASIAVGAGGVASDNNLTLPFRDDTTR
jgi:Fic family protein